MGKASLSDLQFILVPCESLPSVLQYQASPFGGSFKRRKGSIQTSVEDVGFTERM